ncbi:MAG: ABC transporter substrate-binding protein [Dehalococcoidia bacterium]|nr:ABC transporter substrate-binding protein [Dehalococcoidia bacterium]
MDNYWTRKASRRALLRGTGVGALGVGAAVAVGCGDDDNTSKTTTAATTSAATSAATTAAATGSATAAATTAAGGTPTEGSYYSGYSIMPGTTLDMHRELYRGNVAQVGLAYNNLLGWGDIEKGTIAPEIAAKLPEQPDKQTFIFTIRTDVKWHNKAPANGRALTMEDVKWNIERQRSKKTADGQVQTSFYRNPVLYADTIIDKAEYLDDKTFKITLKKPDATWLTNMCDEFNAIENREVMEQVEKDFGTFDAKYILGTGPFVFDRYSPQTQAHAVRNPDYFLKKAGQQVAYFDEIFWTNLGTDTNAIRVAFEQKQLDIMSAGKDIVDAVLKAQPSAARLQIPNPNGNLELSYNYDGPKNQPDMKSPAFSDKRLRQAMFIAIDRTLVGQQAYQGLARPNPAINWPFTEWALPQTELVQNAGYRTNKDDDIKEARELWKQGGGDAVDAKYFDITIVDAADQSIKEWFPAMMNKNLGTSKFAIHAIPISSLLEVLVKGTDPVGYLGAWDQWVSPDPRQRFASVYSKDGQINWWRYADPAMEDLIQKSIQEFDTAKAIAYLKDAQRLALKDGGSGHWQMVSSLTQAAIWPYTKRVGPTFIGYEKQLGQRSWIDQKDPTFNGRKKPA